MLGTLIALIGLLPQVTSQCIADETINTQFAELFSNGTSITYEVAEGSCCQETICAIPCPEEVSPPDKGKLRGFSFQNVNSDVELKNLISFTTKITQFLELSSFASLS
jgi:hypothetical protein